MAENKARQEPRPAGAGPGKAEEGVAPSVGREPDPMPTPQDDEQRVTEEDEPKGHPTSDRFHSEQAHRKPKGERPGE